MNRMLLFSGRNAKEILRDPLSYVFCIGFPIIMLVIMSIVNESIPPEAEMDIFGIKKLFPAVGVFGLMFVMLFAALQVSKDRSGSFLIRLYASPMKTGDFTGGYFLTCIVIAIAQYLLCSVCAFIIAAFTDVTLNVGYVLLSALFMLIPASIFVGFGILFGSLLSDKAAPGLCSIIVSAGTMLGGIFMDVDGIGGVIQTVCSVLPFYHCVKLLRSVAAGDLSDIGASLLIALAYAVVVAVAAVIAFGRKMKADLN